MHKIAHGEPTPISDKIKRATLMSSVSQQQQIMEKCDHFGSWPKASEAVTYKLTKRGDTLLMQNSKYQGKIAGGN